MGTAVYHVTLNDKYFQSEHHLCLSKCEFWFRYFLDSFVLLGSGMAVKSPVILIMARLFANIALL